MAENYIKNTIIQTLKKLQRSKKYNLNIDKIIKDSSINGNELNDFLGALARYALEEIPKNKELSEEDKSMTKAMLLLWMLASTNSLDVLINKNNMHVFIASFPTYMSNLRYFMSKSLIHNNNVKNLFTPRLRCKICLTIL